MTDECDRIELRDLNTADITEAERLRAAAGFNQTVKDWERLLYWQPDGCFAAVCGRHDRVVGTVTSTIIGEMAWIGMVLVDPTHRGRGIGGRLMREVLTFLKSRKEIAIIGLDATPQGKKLYDGLGFREASRLSRWQGTVQVHGRDACHKGMSSLVEMNSHDAVLVEDLDQQVFGVSRHRILHELLKDPEVKAYRMSGGDGYAMVRPGAYRWHLGPVVARTEMAGQQLISELIRYIGQGELEMDVPAGAWESVVARFGLNRQRPFFRMYLGDATPNLRESLCAAIIAPEVG